MISKVSDIVVTLLGVALVTTLVLPNRQTAKVISATGSAGSSLIKAATGR